MPAGQKSPTCENGSSISPEVGAPTENLVGLRGLAESAVRGRVVEKLVQGRQAGLVCFRKGLAVELGDAERVS